MRYIREHFQNLKIKATRFGRVRTWQSLLQEMAEDVRNNPYWESDDMEPDTAMDWITAVWIKLEHSRNLHEIDAVVVLQYVWESYRQRFHNALDPNDEEEGELVDAEQADLLHEALTVTCVGHPLAKLVPS